MFIVGSLFRAVSPSWADKSHSVEGWCSAVAPAELPPILPDSLLNGASVCALVGEVAVSTHLCPGITLVQRSIPATGRSEGAPRWITKSVFCGMVLVLEILAVRSCGGIAWGQTADKIWLSRLTVTPGVDGVAAGWRRQSPHRSRCSPRRYPRNPIPHPSLTSWSGRFARPRVAWLLQILLRRVQR